MRIDELLAAGRYAEGFALYEAWRGSPEYPESPARGIARALGAPVWRGEEVTGRSILVLSEEGFGDQIMFARFAKLLQERGADVWWLCPAELSRLLSDCGGLRTIPAIGSLNLGRPDFCIPSSALPAAFFPPLEEPPPRPYLTPPPPHLVPGARVGVVASGNPRHLNDVNRSLPAEVGELLLRVPGAISLLPADTGARDFYDTATVIAALDVVVSVDTSVAHLAAAMGKRTIVLLPAIGRDWRWGDGVRSPWYPHATLVRQPAPGDWSHVLRTIAELPQLQA